MSSLLDISGVFSSLSRSRVEVWRDHGEEPLLALTHGIGLLLACAGTALLLPQAAFTGDPWRLLGCAVYAGTLVSVYAASTLSHLPFPSRWNRWFRSLDQGCIYLLIVGSYTPFSLMLLRSPSGMMFLALLWLVAGWGFHCKVILQRRIDDVRIGPYVALGWLESLAVPPVIVQVSVFGIAWLVAGGVAYTVGSVFLLHEHRGAYFHTIWHVLVIVGSVCHFVAIWGCVMA